METKRYNSNGEELFEVSEGYWLPVGSVPKITDSKKYYARFEHPHINFFKISFITILLIALFVVGGIVLNNALHIRYGFLIILGIYIVLVVLFINKLAILCIKLYQYFAPMATRERCVFTPTCSSYAIQALTKYNFFKAITLIKSRLKRCYGSYRDDPLE